LTVPTIIKTEFRLVYAFLMLNALTIIVCLTLPSRFNLINKVTTTTFLFHFPHLHGPMMAHMAQITNHHFVQFLWNT